MVVGFGTYDSTRHPRIRILLDGLAAAGADVREMNVPLAFSTAERVEMLAHPWRLYRLLGRLVACWSRLTALRLVMRRRPDVVVVGYLGQFDVLLARLLFPRATIVLDLLVFGADTATDRGLDGGLRTWILRLLDRVACGAASLVVVDTPEHLELLGPRRHKGVVVPVGAAAPWFQFVPRPPPVDGPLRVIFFGLFTPLQGAPVIAEAIARLPANAPVELLMVGSGQDHDSVVAAVGDDPRVSWTAWVDPAALPKLVASYDVCLGIFGTGSKALRVVPNKVYQGAAAGCMIITSDTTPQRRALGDAAVYVEPGDGQALADVLLALANDRTGWVEMTERASRRAEQAFRADVVVQPLLVALGMDPRAVTGGVA